MSINEIMPIDHIADWEKRLARQDAFWDCQIIDRPVVHITVPKKNPDFPKPAPKNFSTLKDRWLDAEYVAECKLHQIMNTDFLGDALPYAWPNLGPEIFSAYFGMELEYGENTVWGIPNLKSWNDIDKIVFSEENPYWKKTAEMTNALLEIGKNKFYTGYTDLHPGADCIAAFRGPMELNYDIIDHPEKIKSLVNKTNKSLKKVMDYYKNLLHTNNKQACASWMAIVSSRTYHILGNDFSSMISTDMFNDYFLKGLEYEAQLVDETIFHIDGLGVLNHLDSILEIKNLSTIQWVHGAGNGRTSDWLDIYKKCQNAGKGIWLLPDYDEVDTIMEHLKPEGTFMIVCGVKNKEHGEDIIKKIEKWK